MRGDHVIAATATHYGLKRDQLRGGSRVPYIVKARQVAAYLLRDLLACSYPSIGAALAEDHTSAMDQCRRIAALLEAGDAQTLGEVAAIRDALGKLPTPQGDAQVSAAVVAVQQGQPMEPNAPNPYLPLLRAGARELQEAASRFNHLAALYERCADGIEFPTAPPKRTELTVGVGQQLKPISIPKAKEREGCVWCRREGCKGDCEERRAAMVGIAEGRTTP